MTKKLHKNESYKPQTNKRLGENIYYLLKFEIVIKITQVSKSYILFFKFFLKVKQYILLLKTNKVVLMNHLWL